MLRDTGINKERFLLLGICWRSSHEGAVFRMNEKLLVEGFLTYNTIHTDLCSMDFIIRSDSCEKALSLSNNKCFFSHV